MFGGCKKLKRIKGINNFNTVNVTNVGMMFKKCEALRNLDVNVEEGIFQADMKVKFTNDGPVTIILEN